MGRWLTIRAAVLAACGLLTVGTASGARAQCYDWAEARLIIERQGLIPVQEISSALRRRGQQPIRLEFCKKGDDFFYVMNLLGPDGHVREVDVNARTALQGGALPGNRPDSYLASPIPSSPFSGRTKKRHPPSGYKSFLPGFLR